MGLDITAYSHVTPIGLHTGSVTWCDEDDHITAIAYDVFPRSFAGIPVLSSRKAGEFTFVLGGCYATTSQTKQMHFQAGSYGGYNRWRAHLASMFNPEREPEGPFYELIWFADNEGTIGAVASARLLTAFEQHADAYRTHVQDNNPGPLDGEWYLQRYQHWTEAFRLGTANGLVEFH